MENLKERCIKLLEKNNSHVIKTNKDAEAIFNEIICIVQEDKLEDFIEYDLCLFSSRDNALNWFLSEDIDFFNIIGDMHIEITPDMVGVSLINIIKDSFLHNKENYIKVNDNIHLTYWM